VTVSPSPGTASTAVAQQPTDCATTDRTLCLRVVRMYIEDSSLSCTVYYSTHMHTCPADHCPFAPDSCGSHNPLAACLLSACRALRSPLSPPSLLLTPSRAFSRLLAPARTISPDLCMPPYLVTASHGFPSCTARFCNDDASRSVCCPLSVSQRAEPLACGLDSWP